MKTSKLFTQSTLKPPSPSSNPISLYRRHRLKPKHKIDSTNQKLHNRSLNLSANLELVSLKPNSYQKLQLQKPNTRYRSRSHTEKDEVTNNLSHLKSRLTGSKVQSQRTNLKKLIQSLKYMRASSDLFKPRSRQPSIGKKPSSGQFLPHMAFAYRTKQGVLKSNPSKPNQDSLLIKSKVTDQNNYVFAVADGHGMYGHDVSQYVIKNLPKLMDFSLKTLNPPEAFKAAFAKLQQGVTETEINSQYSGTTLISILLRKDELFCANVGDSRAILVTQNKRKTWEIAELSRDHKPDLPAQKERILKLGGRIQPFRDQNGNQVGPQRVWLGKQKMQGLAMSRSIGDNVSKPVGVTFQPQIIYRKITQNDKYIIMGSDGLWQLVSNQQASKLLIPHYLQNNVEAGVQQLLNLAYGRWEQEDDTVIDDITIIVIFLQ